MEIKRIQLHERHNETGSLAFAEAQREIPFAIKRIYYIYGVKNGARRGFHAHKQLQQVLICVHGSCKVLLDDGREKAEVLLDDPGQGLIVDKGIWHEMYQFSFDAVLLVLASDYYDESDYLRDYQQFLDYWRK